MNRFHLVESVGIDYTVPGLSVPGFYLYEHFKPCMNKQYQALTTDFKIILDTEMRQF